MDAILELLKLYPNIFADLGAAIIILAPYAIYASKKTTALSTQITRLSLTNHTLSSDIKQLQTEIGRLSDILDKITTIKIKID